VSKLLRSGGFSPAHSVAGNATGIPCAGCGTSFNLAWVHVANVAAICRQCMPDPDADDGEAGERMARWLTGAADEEREEPGPSGLVGLD
jgi:hypothetical protein